MIKIQKKYYFYAGHRNISAGEKCSRLHGHTYDVKCIFNFDSMENGVTVLFSDIDKLVEPIIKYYDHYFLLHDKDKMCVVFDMHNEPYRELPFETSAENMAIWLFTRIANETKLPICEIHLAETKSSTIIYDGSKVSY
jgi:6-pyruvoyl-tetrahydropterin synthase|tara:strand:- start:131 stop:544 length:414 start_codon:yes stop_codon:yes gene_type:complete